MKHLVVMIFHSRVFAPETKKYVILKLKFPDVFGNCLTSFSSPDKVEPIESTV